MSNESERGTVYTAMITTFGGEVTVRIRSNVEDENGQIASRGRAYIAGAVITDAIRSDDNPDRAVLPHRLDDAVRRALGYRAPWGYQFRWSPAIGFYLDARVEKVGKP
jgi:hypothetical protein